MSWKDFRVLDEYIEIARQAEESNKYVISTPYKVACEMVELLPEELFVPETKFLNIFSKSGQILLALKNRLLESEAMIKRFPDKRHRRQHIVWHQLYGLCINEGCANSTALMLYDTAWNDYNNIVKCENLISLVKEDKNKALEFIHKNFKEYNAFLNESEENGEIMKFDVVIGNPPYNNDMYIPFVELGHQLATKCSVFITPAKWQAKGGKLNEQFRENIVPYMSKIVYYTDTCDLFDIAEWGGISYYIINKIKPTDNVLIKTICSRNNILESDFQEHDETEINLYNRNILTIIGKAGQLGEGFKQSLYVKNTDHGESSITGQLGFKRQVFVGEQDRGDNSIPSDYVEIMQGESVCGYKKKSELFTQLNIDKYKCICSIMPGAVSKFDLSGKVLGMFKISIIKPNQVPKGSFPVLMYFDTYNQCKSFVSYMECKLIAFLYYLGTCGTTLTKEFFRFVPDPQDWSVIYEDKPLPNYIPDENGNYIDNNGNKHCSLYVKYKLTEDDINIIESVIKERK